MNKKKPSGPPRKKTTHPGYQSAQRAIERKSC